MRTSLTGLPRAQEVFWGNNNGLEGFIFADPSIQSDPTTDSATLAAQFDKLVAGLFPLITAKERQAVAQQYPISDAAAVGNSFDRISTVIADSTFVCVLAPSLLLLARALLTLAGFRAAALPTGLPRRSARRATNRHSGTDTQLTVRTWRGTPVP